MSINKLVDDRNIYDKLVDDNNIEDLRMLLSKDIQEQFVENVSSKISFQDILYYLAKKIIESDKINMMEMLIYNFNFDLSHNNFYIVFYCSTHGNVNMMRFLLDISEINCLDSKNETVYKMMLDSCESNDIEVATILLEKGVDANARDGEYLITACEYSHVDIAKLLIESGANVGCRNNEPLYKAINEINYDMVKLLLQYGADMEAVNRRFAKKLNTKRKNFINLLIENNIEMDLWACYLMTNQNY